MGLWSGGEVGWILLRGDDVGWSVMGLYAVGVR
jgi:hypothetical protein